MKRVLEILLRAQSALGVVLFVALTIVVTLQIVSRFIFHSPFLWSEEVARFLFFWVALTGASISVRLRRHFVIDVFSFMHAPEKGTVKYRVQVYLKIFGDVCVLAFSVLLFYLGWQYTELGLFRTGTNSEVNMAAVYLAIPVAAGTMVVYGLANLIDLLTGEPTRKLPDHHNQNEEVL